MAVSGGARGRWGANRDDFDLLLELSEVELAGHACQISRWRFWHGRSRNRVLLQELQGLTAGVFVAIAEVIKDSMRYFSVDVLQDLSEIVVCHVYMGGELSPSCR